MSNRTSYEFRINRALLRQGEGERIEFKAAEADAVDISRTIVALANSGGGSILLGVGDDGEILGLSYAQPPHHRPPHPHVDRRRHLAPVGRHYVQYR